jgi:anaerobic magnesium-protoporphyrin IX monomethyl ester cyclase
MNVVLIEPRYGSQTTCPWTPIGKAYLAGALRVHGFKVRIVDCALDNPSDDELAKVVEESHPDVVAMGGMTLQLSDMQRMARLLRQRLPPWVLLVGGGVHFTLRPEDGLDHFDVIVIGEGEDTLVELCTAYAGGLQKEARIWEGIPGLCFRSATGQEIRTPARDFIQDLDRLPFPAYDLLRIEDYSDFLVTGQRAISIMTGRGCPYDCQFCASPRLFRRKVRSFSLDYTFAWMEHLMSHYGFTHFRIMDDTFAADRRRVLAFCDEIERRGLRVNMTCLTHVKTSDFEMFSRMKQAGFSIVALGIESGNDRVLKLINKGIRKDEAIAAIHDARRAGLMVEGLFMIGNVGDTRETIEESIQLAREHNPPYRGLRRTGFNYFQFATPFPGSRFYEEARDYGAVTSLNYDEYSHQVPVFIPRGLDAPTLVSLRRAAMKRANEPALPRTVIRLADKCRAVMARVRGN